MHDTQNYTHTTLYKYYYTSYIHTVSVDEVEVVRGLAYAYELRQNELRQLTHLQIEAGL